MDVILSRRIKALMDMDSIINLPYTQFTHFIKELIDVDNFNSLAVEWRTLILQAERELEELKIKEK